MSEYFVSIIVSFINVFINCYLIYWIVSLFRSVKGPKVAFILITIDVCLQLISPIKTIINLSSNVDELRKNGVEITNEYITEVVIICVCSILVVLSAYLIFLYLFYFKNFVFKSARAKKFEREYSGKGKVLTIISRVFLIVFGLSFIVGSIILFVTNNDKYVVYLGILFFVIGIFLTYLFIKSFIGLKNSVHTRTNQEKISKYYFIIISDYNTYLFENNGDISFKDALNGFDDLYYVDEFCIIKGADKRIVYGLKISQISEGDLAKLNMNRVYDDKLISVLRTLDKVHQKVITIDEYYNIVSEENR